MGIKVVVACEVEDVANFKSVFELGRVRREEAGIYNSEVYQDIDLKNNIIFTGWLSFVSNIFPKIFILTTRPYVCLLYTSDAADE